MIFHVKTFKDTNLLTDLFICVNTFTNKQNDELVCFFFTQIVINFIDDYLNYIRLFLDGDTTQYHFETMSEFIESRHLCNKHPVLVVARLARCATI